MQRRTATYLVLALLLAAGLGVSAGTTDASGIRQTSKKKPSLSSKAAAGSARTTSAKKSIRKGGKHSSSRRNRGQKAPTTDRVTEIQQALAKDGSYEGTPNGKWDEQTVSAMKKYQQSRGLNPSGKLDAKTLQQLGLGSQTAGVAPPMPPVSSSSAVSPATKSNARRQ